MVSSEFLEKVEGKFVHVDFIDFKDNLLTWVEGKLNYSDEDFIEITSDTDCDIISLDSIRKIYVKEEKK